MGDANDSNTTCLLCGDMHRGDCPLLNVLGRKVSNAPDPDSEPQDRANDEPVVQQATFESEELDEISIWIEANRDVIPRVWVDVVWPEIEKKLMQWRTKSLLALLPREKGDEIDPGFLRDGYNAALQDIKKGIDK